jgi:hypothetical protein
MQQVRGRPLNALDSTHRDERKTKPRPPEATGALASTDPKVRSVGADIDDTEAVAEVGQHAAGLIASFVAVAATDEADAEAMAPVMMIATSAAAKAAAPFSAATAAGRSRGGSQRHRAEGSCCNECEREFAKHGRSPECAPRRGLLALVSVLPTAHQSLPSGAGFE